MPRPETLPSVARWTRATALGWALGVPLVVLLSVLAEAGDVEGLQSPIGLGMGLALGLVQLGALRARGARSSSWFWATFAGLSPPFAAIDLARLAGIMVPDSLYVAVPVGGLLAGLLQALALRSAGVRPLLWSLASTLGWSLATASVALADSLRHLSLLHGLAGALLYLVLAAAGGPLLGLATGLALRHASRVAVASPSTDLEQAPG